MDMIYSVFLKILGMAWQATFVIMVVLLIRSIIGNASKTYAYMLWILVAVRLICPVMISSQVSMFNVVNAWEQNVNDYINGNDSTSGNNAIQQQAAADPSYPKEGIVTNSNDAQDLGTELVSNTNTESVNKKVTWAYESMISTTLIVIWLSGMLIMMIYSMLSYVHLKYKIRFATRKFDNVYECEQIAAPFVLGIVNPRVYIPYQMKDKELKYILAHEEYHIKRKDYLIKLAAFMMLCVYWFHPLVWIAYCMMCRDMEMSCDERVLANTDETHKKEYSRVMLAFAENKRFMISVPLAFSESNTKKRVKQILYFKKPAAWIGMSAIILLIIAMMVCLTDATDKKETKVSVLASDANAKEETLKTESKKLYYISELDLSKTTGVEVILDYADDNIVIFHGYFGMFVYNLKSEEMILSVDLLQTLGINYIQGDEVVSINVDEDGSNILLCTIGGDSGFSDRAFTIDTQTGEYVHSEYQAFDKRFADYNEYGELDRSKYGYISEGSNIGSICYISADEKTVYEVFSEYATGENGGTIANVEAIAPIVWYADLTQDGIDERIEVDLTYVLNYPETGEEQTVVVYSGKTDELIWTGHADTVHLGWNGIYVYNDGTKDCLLIWKPTMYQGRAEYSYQAFTLKEDGEEQMLFAKGLEFDENKPYECDVDAITTYVDKVNQYLKKSYVLVDTDGGGEPIYSTGDNKITHTYDVSEVLKSIAQLKQ